MNPYIDLGGAGATIHFAPANGFPPECYRPLAAALAPDLHTIGYRPRPLRPLSDPAAMHSWHDLAADLLADLQAVAATPMIGGGHSLGGILTLYAALRRPNLFKGLVLIDPVIMPRRLLPLIWLAKRSGQIYRHPLVQGATRRRDRFAGREEARQRFTGRGVFAALHPDALDAYVQYGLTSDGDGVKLAWPKAWEAAIFADQPLDVWDGLKKLHLPLLLIRGTHSDLIIDDTWRTLRKRLPYAEMVEIAGGHMVPLEAPLAVADAIRTWVRERHGDRVIG
ncbi:MAG: alpha/beta hydrolase [Oscillochloris sp.]|nr:alpha/beta hydrolase [Oscillochloris sp.]